MPPALKEETIKLMVINNLERQMKKLLKQKKSLMPAIVKAQRKYKRLVDNYHLIDGYFQGYVKKRDSMMEELSKSRLNKQVV